MTVAQIRQQFFDFFQSKGHQIVSSAPMVVKNDPTLMFTNAGMNQFKDYFLGYQQPTSLRIANSQKCLRVSGKHNDLEEVGVDTYHHTMFEMLGNWSFGDYFKEEAIAWAWELLTEVYKIPKDQLYVTVFEGDASDGVPMDNESFDIWKKFIAADRIILASKKDNFWEMGDTGPCGPCTEIHVDLRNPSERSQTDGKLLVNADHPQVIEIWNNVFMEFNRKADGSLQALPSKHVDTGMGLERLAMALQAKQSNYDTDLFQTLINFIAAKANVPYGQNEEKDIALRVIADHIRAIAFSIADGQLPSNNGAGYVIRRILRRAVRYGYQTLGLKEPFLCELSVVLSELMGQPYTELLNQKELIFKVIKEEELSFFRTLELGIKRIDDLILQLKAAQQSQISGAAAFELYDTYGFPLDLTSLIARENNLSIDEAGFEKELQVQKDRSRAATNVATDDWIEVRPDVQTRYVGYDIKECVVEMIKYRKVSQKGKSFYQIVLDQTPFYAEGGGQIGDQGVLSSQNEQIVIFDTKKENNLIVHLCTEIPAAPELQFVAKVNLSKQQQTAKNHSATHLLHHALREILGTHVEQKGSLVTEKGLRFDFSHFSKVNDEQLIAIENHVNEAIKAALPLVEERSMSIDEAKQKGAMALFGEKYGEKVRVIEFGPSVELCGGIHVQNTNEIGIFKLVTETAVAAGIRRIEAISGDAAMNYYKEKAQQLEQIEDLLKKPKDILKAIEALQSKNQALEKELERLAKMQAQQLKNELKGEIKEFNGYHLLIKEIKTDAASAKDILFGLRQEFEPFVGVLAHKETDKCGLTILLDETLAAQNNWNAAQWIRESASLIQGGGGGQSTFATAGGKNPSGLQAALQMIQNKLSEQ
jgi:alanyl-tRNA synthetase